MSRANKLVPMGKLLNVIETAGYKLVYHYNEFVFIDNTSLMFRFNLEDTETVYLHFNDECTAEARENLTPFLLNIAKDEGLKLKISSFVSLIQKEGTEEIEIKFQ